MKKKTDVVYYCEKGHQVLEIEVKISKDWNGYTMREEKLYCPICKKTYIFGTSVVAIVEN